VKASQQIDQPSLFETKKMMVAESTKGTASKKLPGSLVIKAFRSNFTPVVLCHLNTTDN
jgi:hypothetical protein